MFDIQLEFEILQDTLQELLALDYLEGDMLADALMDLGYVSYVISYHAVKLGYTKLGIQLAFNTIGAHIKEYKKAYNV